MRLSKRDGSTVLSIEVGSLASEDVDVVVRGDDLWVGLRDFERRVSLPDSLSGLAVASAELVDGVLEVAFEPVRGAPAA